MVRAIEDHRIALEALCRRFQVRRLELFGSAVGETFDQTSSDLDFIVEFDDWPTAGYADAYFGLAEALQSLFHRDIDLVVYQPSRIHTSAQASNGRGRCCMPLESKKYL